MFAHPRVHSSHPHLNSAVHRSISFCWPNERPFQLNHHCQNHYQCCSSSSHDDSVLASEDHHWSAI